jgi:hypothetical protein
MGRDDARVERKGKAMNDLHVMTPAMIAERLAIVRAATDWADVVEILDWYQRDVAFLLEEITPDTGIRPSSALHSVASESTRHG